MFSELAKESNSDMSHDEIFELQTLDLTKCILNLKELNDLKLIRKWHNLLCKAKPQEHEKRNELCAIMLQQLRREGKLCAVFHDKEQEIKPLDALLQEIRIHEDLENGRFKQNKTKVESEHLEEAAVKDLKELKENASENNLDLLGKMTPSRITMSQIFYPNRTQRGDDAAASNEVKRLEQQLQSLQLRFDAQHQTLRALELEVRAHESENVQHKQALEVLMLNVAQHFQNYLTTRGNGSKIPLKFFTTNFAYLTKDLQMLAKMKELDRGLERSFNLYAKNVRNNAKQKIEMKTMQNTEKFRYNMLVEIETIANTQLWVQEVRVRAMKQQFLAALRTQLSKLKCERAKVNFNIEKILKLVEREYRKIFEDLVTVDA